MLIFIFIILGIIQGLTEFLPISSSGHLMLFYNIFGIKVDSMFLNVLLHISTLFAILIYYRKTIIVLLKHPICKTNLKLLTTTITTIIIVLIIKPIIDFTYSSDYLFIFFTLTAFILFLSDYVSYKRDFLSHIKIDKISKISYQNFNDICNIKISYTQAIFIGIAQAIACIPGISRSGSTIATAKICGVEKDCETYSFLISIPVIIGSLILQIIQGASLNFIFNINVYISMFICFIVGLISIKIITKLTMKNNLSIFGYYLLALSAFLIINNMFLKLF